MKIAVPIKQLYVRLSRAYAKKLGDRPADSMYVFLCSLKFWAEHRYWPRIKKPRSFSEKIFHRMLFDRAPQWTILSDKLRARDFVANKWGTDLLVPLLWNGTDPDKIPFDELPTKFVIKTNHACGFNIIVKDKKQLDQREVKRQLSEWLAINFTYNSFVGMAWAYKNIRPEILVEAFLDDNGKIPLDYKFFCFSGQTECIQVSYDRFGDASERILDRNFRPMNFWWGLKLYQKPIIRPDNYQELLRVAESLAQGFELMRVDLYSVGGRIYFGEFTCYPAAGLARLIPRKYDFYFGEKWK